MKLVEIVPRSGTSEQTVAKTCESARFLGKKPIIAPDISGFYVNGIPFPMTIERISVEEMTRCPPKDFDDSMRLGADLPMDPLRLSDSIGNDSVLSICESLHARTGDPRFNPPDLLKTMVGQRKLGRKTKPGFYDYD